MMVKKWFEVREIFGEFFLWFESKRLNAKFKDWFEYSYFVNKKGISKPWDVKLWDLLLKVKSTLRFKKSSTTYLFSLMPMLLFSLRHDYSSDEKYMQYTCNLLGINIGNKDVRTWVNAVKRFLSGWHAAGVIKEALTLG